MESEFSFVVEAKEHRTKNKNLKPRETTSEVSVTQHRGHPTMAAAVPKDVYQ